MKTKVLPILLLLLVSLTAISGYAQTIPNPYFEWFENKTTPIAANWSIQGNTSKVQGPGTSLAIRLQNEKNSINNTSIAQVKFDDSGRQAPAFKLNGTPDSLRITFKSALLSDSAFIFVFAKQSGDSFPAIFQEIILSGNSGWNTKSFALDYIHPDIGVNCDTAYIIVYSSNPVSVPNASGYLDIADFTFTKAGNALTNIPNHNFSNWDNVGVEWPVDWTTHQILYYNDGLQYASSSRSNDARTGSSSLVLRGLVHKQPNGKSDTFPAFAVTTRSRDWDDMLTPDNGSPSFSLNSRPASFHGYTKTNLFGDKLLCFVNLFNSDTIVGSTVIVIDSNSSQFKKFSQDISWLPGYTGNADKATIAFYLLDSTGNGMNTLSIAWIDDIWFENFGVNTQSVKQNPFMQVFPNPCKDFIQIQHNSPHPVTVYLTSLTGNIVKVFRQIPGNGILNVGDISTGIYILNSPDIAISKKIFIQP